MSGIDIGHLLIDKERIEGERVGESILVISLIDPINLKVMDRHRESGIGLLRAISCESCVRGLCEWL